MPLPTPIEYYYTQRPSIALRFVSFALRHILKPAKNSAKSFTSGEIYRRADVPAPMPKLDADIVTVRVTQVQGRQVFTLRPTQAAGRKTVLYLHGGAYVSNFSPQHWTFLQKVVQQTGYPVVAPDYPLAPQHTYAQVFAMVQPVYEALAAQVGAENVLLMGDSAGAGLALALAEKLKQEHRAMPGQLLLLSPWLDAALENPAIAPVAPLDPFLSVTNLRLAAHAYAGATPLSHYQLSPLNGDLTGLPRTTVFIGTHDIFVADARKFKQLMAQQGNPINYFEYDQAVHVWMLIKMPEGKKAQQQIIDLLKS